MKTPAPSISDPAAPGNAPRPVGTGLRGWPALRRLLAFFALLVCALWLTDAAINAGLRRIRTSGFGVSNRILAGQVNAEVLITGSSRAVTHYDPRVLEARTGRRVFNIGINGSQTDMQLARLKAYLQHNPKPALIIHNLDLFSFQVTHGGVYDPGQYLPYLRESALYQALERIDPAIRKARWLPLYGYAVQDLRLTWLVGIRGLLGWNPAEDHVQGFTPRRQEWTGDFERFRASNPEGLRVAVEPEGVAVMNELVRLCRDQDIPLVLVYSPEYAEMQQMTANRGELFDRIRALQRDHGVPLLDFSDSTICAARTNFYNSQHLNDRGAAVFSGELADRMLQDAVIASYLRPAPPARLSGSPAAPARSSHASAMESGGTRR